MTAWLVLLGLMVGSGPGDGGPPALPMATASIVKSPAAESAAAESPAAGAPWAAGQRAAVTVPDRWVAEDKARHFAMAFAATSMAYGGARLALQPEAGRGAAAGVALLLSVGKELVDARRGGPFSLKDLA